jgi:hypothetical protein
MMDCFFGGGGYSRAGGRSNCFFTKNLFLSYYIGVGLPAFFLIVSSLDLIEVIEVGLNSISISSIFY